MTWALKIEQNCIQFDPNLSSESESLWQNWLKHQPKCWNPGEVVKTDFKYVNLINNGRNRSKNWLNCSIFNLFGLKLTYFKILIKNWLLLIENWLILIATNWNHCLIKIGLYIIGIIAVKLASNLVVAGIRILDNSIHNP